MSLLIDHPSTAIALAGAVVIGACGRARAPATEPVRAPAAEQQAAPVREDSMRAITRAQRIAARDSSRPALVLFAAASIDELRFDAPPNVSITLRGALGDSVRILERRNLPDPVVAGTTYRNVYVAVEIFGHLNAQCVSSLLTGGGADSSGSRRCAGIEVRDSISRGIPR